MQQVVFTVGYEGLTLDRFLGLLQEAGVRRVVDVRELPLSRRRGFSKSALRAALEGSAIEYVHLREAGNPYRRVKARIDECLRLFRGYLSGAPEVVPALERLVAEVPSALLCVEADACNCHRSVLVAELLGRNEQLRVEHL